ncbi:MAG: DUF5069 domain-containing protein [Opitutia bacterium]
MSQDSARPMGFSEATGEICYDLPSSYVPPAGTGLLHLPRFIAKIRKHLAGTLPKSYQRNFCKGFDRFLCLHLGVDPEQVIAAVRESSDDASLDARLRAILPSDLRVHVWNRELVQKGMSEMGREALDDAKRKMGASDRKDVISFADMIDLDEGRIP